LQSAVQIPHLEIQNSGLFYSLVGSEIGSSYRNVLHQGTRVTEVASVELAAFSLPKLMLQSEQIDGNSVFYQLQYA